jgi:hypothetical protein
VSDDRVDLANRFVLVLLAMLIAFAALLVVLLAWGATAATVGRVDDFAGYLADHQSTEAKMIVTLGAAVVVLVMAMVIIIELTPPSVQRMRVRTMRAGDATITTTEIAARVEAEVKQAPGVEEARALVTPRGQRIELLLELDLARDAKLAETADEACGRAQSVVESGIGIALTQPPRARMHYRELQLREERAVPEGMRREGPPRVTTGWERPGEASEGERDQRGKPDAPEEAQA